jgi:hypothetical protein
MSKIIFVIGGLLFCHGGYSWSHYELSTLNKTYVQGRMYVCILQYTEGLLENETVISFSNEKPSIRKTMNMINKSSEPICLTDKEAPST